MDSIKGEHVVRLDKYFINFFGIATNEVTRGPVPRHKQTLKMFKQFEVCLLHSRSFNPKDAFNRQSH